MIQARRRPRVKTGLAVFFFFLCIPEAVSALQLKADSPATGIGWTLETVLGYQHISGQKSTDGSDSSSQNTLFYSGFLFNAEIEQMPFITSCLILGFEKNPHLIWSESPDLLNNTDINALLRGMEYSVQVQLPCTITYHVSFYPFAGYSFIDYSYSTTTEYLNPYYNHYSAFVVGLQYHHIINHWLSEQFFFSFSPFSQPDASSEYVHYFNYGGSVQFNTRPLAIDLFLSFRTAYFSDTRIAFYTTEPPDRVKTAEVGLSFHLNL
jgi:hypothetical protein